MFSIENLSFTYPGRNHKALNDISLQVSPGDFLGITGPSGAGKSTLAHAMNGIIPHYIEGDYLGHVRVAGTDTFECSLTDISKLVGTVFQDIDSQMVSSVVEDEILFGLENFGLPHSEIPKRIDEALDCVGIQDLRTRTISSLSGGQKQKVALAAMVALKPKALILDEPTGELDPASSRSVFELLKMLNESTGATIVVIEQKIMLLSEFAQRLVVLNDGAIAHQGPAREVLRNVNSLEAIGVNVPRVTTLTAHLERRGIEVPLCITSEEAAENLLAVLNEGTDAKRAYENAMQHAPASDTKESIRACCEPANPKPEEAQSAFGAETNAAGNSAVSAAKTEAHTKDTTVLEFKNVSFAYPGGGAGISEVNFSVQKGQFVALIGNNGAGKSTTSKLMNGLLKPKTGQVLVNGVPTTELRPSQIAQSVGMFFQNPDHQLCKNTVHEEIAFTLDAHGIDRAEAQARVEEIVRRFGFDPEAEPYMMSRGERQRLALASTLAAQPNVLILDEPTTGLDYRECCSIMDYLKELNETKGTTIVMVCHDMEVVLDYAQNVLVMAHGSLCAQGSCEEVFGGEDLMRKAHLLPPQIIEVREMLAQRGITCKGLKDIHHISQLEDFIANTVSLRLKEEV